MQCSAEQSRHTAQGHSANSVDGAGCRWRSSVRTSVLSKLTFWLVINRERKWAQGRCGHSCWLTLSIHLPYCQGGPPPSNLSSRPKRSAAEGPAVSLSGAAKVSWANRLLVPFLHQRKLQSLRSATPDFVSNLVALANFMRLSLLKAARAAVAIVYSASDTIKR